MGFGKRGSGVGDMVEMIPVLAVISAIAVVMFGISATYYSYEISVRDAEARLLSRAVVECLSPEGVLNLDGIDKGKYNEVLSYCGFENDERFYVGVEVFDIEGKSVGVLSEGDSGRLWVRDLFGKAVLNAGVVLTGNAVDENTDSMVKYNPGYFSFEYPSLIISDGKVTGGDVKVEVLVNYE